ncbi:DUF6053 domain-containing protein [Lysobacter yananisis]|uniref:DUF6053 domain-containing protein n=1 Tax=Lysobacter yananisis TaxID=1003114 RepID=UPI003CE51BA5
MLSWEGLQPRCFRFQRCAAIGSKSVGPEGPPTNASLRIEVRWRRLCGRGFSPDAFLSEAAQRADRKASGLKALPRERIASP